MIKKPPLRLIFSGIADTIRKNERGAVIFKKLIAVLLRAVVFCCAEGAVATAKTSGEADTHLQYGADGKFRIMQISDIQDYFPMKMITKKVLKKALAEYPVDLIVLTGDNIASTTLIKPYARLAMHQYMSILEKLGTPVVMVYGNHDDERTTANKAYQMSVYEKNSIVIYTPYRIVSADNHFGIYDFSCLGADSVHFVNPAHLVLRFQSFVHAISRCPFFYEPGEHILRLCVNFSEVGVYLAVEIKLKIQSFFYVPG